MARPRLTAMVAPHPAVGLTVVKGPGGAGKTVALAEWAEGLPEGTWAWIALREGDTAESLLRSLLGALGRLGGEVGPVAAHLLDEGAGPAAAVAALAGALDSSTTPVVVVLDDLHHVRDRAAGALLGALVDRCAPELHLVIATREPVPFPLGKLRVSGRLAEVGRDDLACTDAEAGALAAPITGRALPAAVVRALNRRCAGWAVGVRLAAKAIAASSEPAAAVIAEFSGSAPSVVAYFDDEVFGPEDEDVRDLLVDTAVFDRFDGALAEAVTAGGDGGEAVRSLVERELFLVPDDEGGSGTFRYRPLFLDYLRHELARRPKELPLVHGRAARAMAERGEVVAAFGHALASGDQTLLVDLVIAHHATLTDRGGVLLVRAALEAVSDGTMLADPLRALECAFAMGYAGRPAEAVHLLGRVEATAGDDPEVAERILTLRAAALAAAGFLDQVLAVKRQLPIEPTRPVAVDEAGARLPLWVGRVFTADERFDDARARLVPCLASCAVTTLPGYIVRGAIAEMLVAEGRLGEAQAEAARALGEWREDGSPPSRGILDAVRAEARLQRERGCRDEAERFTEEVLAGLEAFPRTGASVDVLTVALQCELALAAGRAAEAVDRIDAASSDWRSFPPGPQFDARVAEVEARAAVLLDDVARLERAVPRLRGPAAALVGARAALARGDRPGAAGHLLLIDASAPLPRRIEAELLRALVAGDDVTAARHVARALALGLPAGYRASFATEAPLVEIVLAQLADHPAAADVVRRAAIVRRDPAPATTEQPTERERDLLALLPTHLSNAEMAAELYLSLNTVKTHLKSLYRKLGAANRSAAVAEARARGWL